MRDQSVQSPNLCQAFSPLLLLGLIALLTGACQESPSTHPGRVLIIAVDGATFRVIDPMMKAGQLPNLQTLAQEGAAGEIRSHQPLLSPRVWTSVATGKTPPHHGIENWIHKDGSGGVRLYTSRDRNGHALWNIVSDGGEKVGVVNWLMTHPPEKIQGVMISDFAFPSISEKRLELAQSFGQKMVGTSEVLVQRPTDFGAGALYPPQWTDRFASWVEETSPLTQIANPFEDESLQADEETRKYLSQVFRNDVLSARAALAIEDELHPALLMVYLPGIDRVSHFIWAGQELRGVYPESMRPSVREHRLQRQALRSYYAHVDELIGLLSEGYGPNDLVIVLSDHGFEAGGQPTSKNPLPGVHESDRALNGIFFARGRGVPSGYQVQPSELSVNDITPTVLAWKGIPVARNMQGQPAGFIEMAPMRFRSSYDDTAEIERVTEHSPSTEKEILKQLKSLGYVAESCDEDDTSMACGGRQESTEP
ncbi:MAG: alkaline phosphatase family protein [Myxococcota bacterium]|nr:alkaline phosphatase family protein [Myxococcota bacterium]